MTGPASYNPLTRGVGGFLSAYYAARQAKREDEDHNRYLAQLRSADMAQPGAESEGAALENPDVLSSLTPDSLNRIGNASAHFDPRRDLEFRGGRQATVSRGAGGTPTGISFADTQPRYRQTATGVVIDREAARQETIGDYMDRLRAQRSVEDEVPWYRRQGYSSPEEAGSANRIMHPQEYVRPTGPTPQPRNQAPWESIMDADPKDQPRLMSLFGRFSTMGHPRSTTTSDNRRLLMLQRNLDSAQRDMEDLERDPQYQIYQRRHGFQPDGRLNQQPGSDWVRRYSDSQQRFQAAQDAVNHELQLGGGDEGGADDGSGGGGAAGGGAGGGAPAAATGGARGAGSVNLDRQQGESDADWWQRLRHSGGMSPDAATRMVRSRPGR